MDKEIFSIVIIFLVLLLALFLRTFNLENLPIFHDEAIYLLTTRKIKAVDIGSWKQSFQGEVQKPPSVFLLTSFLIKNNNFDLIRARFFSAFFGILTGLVVYLIALDLWRKREGFFALVLFSFSPFLVFYQRVFLLESFLLFFILLTILILNYSLKKKSFFFKLFLIFLGFLLTSIKQSVFLWIALVFLFPLIGEKRVRVKELLKNDFFILSGLVIGLFFFNFLVGFDAYFIPKEKFIARGLNYQMVIDNFIASLIWVKSYLTDIGFFIVLIAIFLSTFLGIQKRKITKKFLFLGLIFFPVFIQIFIAKYFFARYIFISFAFGLIFIAKELSFLFTRFPLLAIFCFFVLLLQFLIFDTKLLGNITKAPFHENERWQYISGWPSGWGVREISQLILEDKGVKKIASLGERMMPTNGLRFYLEPKRIEVVAYPREAKVELIKEKFLVFQAENGESFAIGKEFKPVMVINKPGGQTKISLYQSFK